LFVINTLAQTETERTGKRDVIITGKGSDTSDIKQLKGRAKRKLVIQAMALSIIDVAKQKRV
jgi:hypothetical protein